MNLSTSVQLHPGGQGRLLTADFSCLFQLKAAVSMKIQMVVDTTINMNITTVMLLGWSPFQMNHVCTNISILCAMCASYLVVSKMNMNDFNHSSLTVQKLSTQLGAFEVGLTTPTLSLLCCFYIDCYRMSERLLARGYNRRLRRSVVTRNSSSNHLEENCNPP